VIDTERWTESEYWREGEVPWGKCGNTLPYTGGKRVTHGNSGNLLTSHFLGIHQLSMYFSAKSNLFIKIVK